MGASGLIDKLTYNYTTEGRKDYINPQLPDIPMPIRNRLNSVTDASGNLEGMPVTPENNTTSYTYDGDGNLKTEGENTYFWSVSGKLAEVKANSQVKVKYLYDAMGNRALKWTPTKGQLYMRDGTGNELVSLEQPTNGTPILKEANIYGSERIGVYKPVAEANGVHTLVNRTFDLKDHLGNIRSTVTDQRTKTSGIYMPTISSSSEYYPFGMETNTYSLNGSENRYGYNGKEKDRTLGVEDYGFRLYKPELARFLSVDPLRKDFPELTTYQFASNTPIQAIDLDGLEAFKNNNTGEVFYGPMDPEFAKKNNFSRVPDDGMVYEMISPLQNPVYGSRTYSENPVPHPITGKSQSHNGTDIRSEDGNTSGKPILSPEDGVIESAKTMEKSPNAGGNRIHMKGKSGVRHSFMHLLDKSLRVKEKDKVKKGDTLAAAGSTGSSTGPHLHYETRKKGKLIDPLKANDGLRKTIKKEKKKEKKEKRKPHD